MKVRFILFYSLVWLYLLTGCSNEIKLIGPKQEVSQYSAEVFNIKNSVNLSINNDTGNVEIYVWNKKEIKFEITKKLRGAQSKVDLLKKLNDFILKIKNENDNIYFNAKYKGNIKSPFDRSIDLKIYLPQRISEINCKMDIGKIKIFDEINCNLNIQMNMVDTQINMFKGKLEIKGDMGDLRINDCEILPDSFVKINNGSIIIKGNLINQGKYDFETGIGNIDLSFPVESKLNIESVGAMDKNEFTSEEGAAIVRVESGMGKISINKY
jgi:hypothetical protein